MPEPSQTGPIAVYGATGYTGRLVARELARRGADFVLAGRSEAKLEIVAEDAGGGPQTAAVELDDAAGLRELFEPCAAVITCAGPFAELGEPVLAAALDAGAHYLDTTGEQAFMRTVFEDYGGRAERAGVAAVTAMGFDYVPGDMIAALTAAGMGTLDELALAYAAPGFMATRGTLRSALGVLGSPGVEWRGGTLSPDTGGVGRGTFEFPPPAGRQRMARYPAGEHITVPRHVDTPVVRTAITAASVAPHPRLGPLAPALFAPLSLALRTPLRRGLDAMISRLPEGPSEQARRQVRFTIVCDAVRADTRRRGVVTGFDVYGLTARSVVHGALLCCDPGFDRAGPLAPSEAFDPRAFLRELGSFGVNFEVEAPSGEADSGA